MGRPLKNDEKATVFALKFVTPLLVIFIFAVISDVFSLAHWTESVFSTMF
ncbi:MAG TPA: hypothetical protein VN420_04645 [Candidatus Fimivivens sp.]|nr:hypothetical protein [Candidatus Fimivivens sp.]